jgi:hypothetical protein
MGDFHVKKIILPSGKAVEIVYFHAEAEHADAAQASIETRTAPTEPGLERCPSCASDLVYPLDWSEAEGDRWELELRCPNCEWGERSVHSQEAVESFDELLNGGTDELIESLERLTRENMQADIDRFVRALESDLILPFDF